MKGWLRRIGGGILMGLAWAIVWAPVAVLIGTTIVDPDNSMDEMWVAIGAYPGFLCGAVFYSIHRIADAGRKLNEVSFSRVGALGMLSGLLVGLLPFVLGLPNDGRPQLMLGVIVIGSLVLLSAASSLGSALLVRMASRT